MVTLNDLEGQIGRPYHDDCVHVSHAPVQCGIHKGD